MEPTVLTQGQIHLLRLFQFVKTDEAVEEMRKVLYDYYSAKMDEELEKLWNDGTLSQARLNEIGQTDLHAWLREQKSLDPIAN